MCTRKLYDETPYETTFNATVLSCMKKEWDEKEAYEVILDQTLFFPEEGGQSPDMGTIDGAEVVDVQIKKNIITHTLTKPLVVGQKVHANQKGCDYTHHNGTFGSWSYGAGRNLLEASFFQYAAALR